MHRSTAFFLCAASALFALEEYRKPPKEVLEVLSAPLPPVVWANQTGTHALIAQLRRYPAIADVAQPFLALAGLRINPNTNGGQLLNYYYDLRMKELGTGREVALTLPANPKLGTPSWSPDGKTFVVINTTTDHVELLVGDAATGRMRVIPKVALNYMFGTAWSWMGSRAVVARTVPAGRGKPPAAPLVPAGPVVQQSSGQSGPVRTLQDMLSGPHDEALFEYYGTSQLAIIDLMSGKVSPFGKPGVYTSIADAPDGKHFLVTRVERPYSYLHSFFAFPRSVEVWDASGQTLYTVAKLPLADNVPIGGVPAGPRSVRWYAADPATLVWTEALDNGNPKAKVPHRDRLMRFKMPFKGEPVELLRVEHRLAGWQPIEATQQALVSDYDRDRTWTRTMLVDFNKPGAQGREIWSRNVRDRYGDPGQPVTTLSNVGEPVIAMNGGSIFLDGLGATPQGERPFLDRMSLADGKTERLHRSGESEYETFVDLLAPDGSRFLTRREGPTEPPNYLVRTTAGETKAITQYKDPSPQLRRITKQLVTYKRADGVDLSFTLYLPPDYKEGTRLPTVLYAYPTEYTDSDVAGQVFGSTQKFTSISGISHLFYVLAGYAVLDATSMPVVGDPETVNNTYVEQITASAKAAIDKAAAIGVTDPDRVGAIGHSYGAFMTGNLLAHTDLFKAGVARSGAYNRTLTPFGFQSERRTYWEAPETYMKMSPFHYAHKIKEPLLLIHGQADNNPGTFPVQSERMYQAVRGNGGTVRLVMLPHESHTYLGRESVEHTLYEMISWFDRYVKGAGN